MTDNASMAEQETVAQFLADHDLHAEPAYRILDLAAEVGEVAADAAKSSEYGAEPDALDVTDGELGDALFALLAVAEGLDIDAGAALETSMAKYEERIAESGEAGSGE
jgi:NTP pyrophosphatase (non-canonical NTP hydrolase)